MQAPEALAPNPAFRAQLIDRLLDRQGDDPTFFYVTPSFAFSLCPRCSGPLTLTFAAGDAYADLDCIVNRCSDHALHAAIYGEA